MILKNKKAAKINEALGVNILDESRDTLTLNKFTKKQIKALCIDDLIQHGRETTRLVRLIREILNEK